MAPTKMPSANPTSQPTKLWKRIWDATHTTPVPTSQPTAQADYGIKLAFLSPGLFAVLLTNASPLLSLKFNVVGCSDCGHLNFSPKPMSLKLVNSAVTTLSKLLNFKLSNLAEGHFFGFSEAVAQAIPVGVDQVLCHVQITSPRSDSPPLSAKWRYCIREGKCIDAKRKAHTSTQECVSGPM
jgi:hypothetical protein